MRQNRPPNSVLWTIRLAVPYCIKKHTERPERQSRFVGVNGIIYPKGLCNYRVYSDHRAEKSSRTLRTSTCSGPAERRENVLHGWHSSACFTKRNRLHTKSAREGEGNPWPLPCQLRDIKTVSILSGKPPQTQDLAYHDQDAGGRPRKTVFHNPDSDSTSKSALQRRHPSRRRIVRLRLRFSLGSCPQGSSISSIKIMLLHKTC